MVVGDRGGDQADPQGDRHQDQRQAGGEDEGQGQQSPAAVLDRDGQVARGQEDDAARGEQGHPAGEERRQHRAGGQQVAHRQAPVVM